MKKLLATALGATMVASAVSMAGCFGGNTGKTEITYPEVPETYKVAMITDYGDITDQSFNQTTYEACLAYCQANSIDFTYKKPAADSTADRVSSVELAIEEGYNVIVMPGYAFGGTVEEIATEYPNVYFIALDVGAGDFSEGYEVPGNVTSFTYSEELAGYMAGYAAVKEGYEKLGFLGGMAVPAVMRYGYGYVQGANAAAVEMNKVDAVTMKYVYGGQFFGDATITAVMDTWYAAGTELVFACGGGIFTSAGEAATKDGVNGKVIGVDVDQKATIEGMYGAGVCVTSAMKGLAATVNTVLADLIGGKSANWNTEYGAKITNMGLVSDSNPELNYVQLPTATWSMTKFTVADYNTLVQKLARGEVVVSNNIAAKPTTQIVVDYQANIK